MFGNSVICNPFFLFFLDLWWLFFLFRKLLMAQFIPSKSAQCEILTRFNFCGHAVVLKSNNLVTGFFFPTAVQLLLSCQDFIWTGTGITVWFWFFFFFLLILKRLWRWNCELWCQLNKLFHRGWCPCAIVGNGSHLWHRHFLHRLHNPAFLQLPWPQICHSVMWL